MKKNIFLYLILFFLVIIEKQQLLSQESEKFSKGIFYFKEGQKLENLDYDSSKYYFEKASEIFKKNDDVEYYVRCLLYLSSINYYQGDYETFSKNTDLALRVAQAHLPDSNYYLVVAISNKLSLLGIKGNLVESVNKGKALLNFLASLDDQDAESSRVMLNLAIDLIKLYDYEEALFYTKEAFKKKKTLGANERDYPMFFNRLGYVYYLLKDYEKAMIFLKEGEKLYLKFPKGDYGLNRQFYILNDIVSVLLDSKRKLEIPGYLEQLEGLLKTGKVVKPYLYYKSLGNYFRAMSNFTSAERTYLKAIQLALENNSEHLVFAPNARQYQNLADLEYEYQNYQKALENYHSALTFLFFDFKEKGMEETPPSLANVSNLQAIQSLHGKAKSLYHIYLEGGEREYLELSLSTYQFAARLIQKARQDIMTSGSKQLLAGEVLPVYEGAIQTALKMYEVTDDKKYLGEAFQFAERNKAILLLESINEQVARSYGGIPDTLQEKERDLRIDIAFYEKMINEEQQKGDEGEGEKIEGWEKILFDLKQDYSDLVNLLEKDYPRYYEFKYNTELASLEAIQRDMLDSESAMLEYFVGEEQVFLFRVTKDDIEVFAFSKDEKYQNDLKTLLAEINSPAVKPEELVSFATASYGIYDGYLAPALADMPETVKRLIIIPDDRLTYLPFEVLLRQPYEGEGGAFFLHKLAYLMEDYNLNYSYSSTLLLKSLKEEKSRASKTMLAMAPSFKSPLAVSNRNCSPDNLYALYCSAEEVETIGSKLKGKYIIGSKAIKETFMQKAKDYQILHLATHSCSDQENPMMSKIYFSDGDISNYDLYNLELNADLAVLSSCNTGSGKLVRGEGVMSLSKGFIHAGCPSTLISLWAVDDCATSDIMIGFYEGLKKGLPKDEALKASKLAYIKSSDKVRKHPYYWAAFVQMGDYGPLEQQDRPRGYILIGVLILLTGGIFWNQSRSKKAA